MDPKRIFQVPQKVRQSSILLRKVSSVVREFGEIPDWSGSQ